MKFREAIQQAWREIGWSEARIAGATKHADRNHLQYIQATHSEVTPGQERALIDALKEMFLKLDQLSPSELEKLAVHEHQKLNQRQ